MMNLGPCIMIREIRGFSRRSAVYLQRQVAKTMITAALVVVSATLAYANEFKIEVNFTGGVHGVGSFTTDGTCLVCTRYLVFPTLPFQFLMPLLTMRTPWQATSPSPGKRSLSRACL